MAMYVNAKRSNQQSYRLSELTPYTTHPFTCLACQSEQALEAEAVHKKLSPDFSRESLLFRFFTYPKLDIVKFNKLLETLVLSLCSLLCLCEEFLCSFWVVNVVNGVTVLNKSLNGS